MKELGDDELDEVTGGSGNGAGRWQLFCSCCGLIQINASSFIDAMKKGSEHNNKMNRGGWGENNSHDANPMQL